MQGATFKMVLKFRDATRFTAAQSARTAHFNLR